ncbi:MAG: hypothetical protein P9L92_16885, partial [Candidatus Electryonea clarkiae]|nr:hypothetical protein [Candidatus Electryonea clarkiae]
FILVFIGLVVFAQDVFCVIENNWYAISSEEQEEPEWQMLSQSSDLIQLRVTIPGFFYKEINNELRIEIPGSFSDVDSGFPEIPSVLCQIGIPQCDSVIIRTYPFGLSDVARILESGFRYI